MPLSTSCQTVVIVLLNKGPFFLIHVNWNVFLCINNYGSSVLITCHRLSFRVDSDENRVPRVIAFAECLCQGCIVNRHEDLGYNSVPIMVWKKVLRKIPCPTDKDKYTVTRETVEVPVACACVKPNAAKWWLTVLWPQRLQTWLGLVLT